MKGNVLLYCKRKLANIKKIYSSLHRSTCCWLLIMKNEQVRNTVELPDRWKYWYMIHLHPKMSLGFMELAWQINWGTSLLVIHLRDAEPAIKKAFEPFSNNILNPISCCSVQLCLFGSLFLVRHLAPGCLLKLSTPANVEEMFREWRAAQHRLTLSCITPKMFYY